MGWKTLKEKFKIGHIVCVTEQGICIGSGYVRDLAVVDPISGKITENKTFNGFVAGSCPLLASASAAEILKAINAPESFSENIAVYTYEGSHIIEKQCQKIGWPNITHDGVLMYDNTYFAEKKDAILKAKKEAEAGVHLARLSVERVQAELVEKQARLLEYEKILTELQTTYPTKTFLDSL